MLAVDLLIPVTVFAMFCSISAPLLMLLVWLLPKIRSKIRSIGLPDQICPTCKRHHKSNHAFCGKYCFDTYDGDSAQS